MPPNTWFQEVRFYLQGPLRQRLDGHNSTTNLNVDQSEFAVCPKFEPNYWVFGHILYWMLVMYASLLAFQEGMSLIQVALWEQAQRNSTSTELSTNVLTRTVCSFCVSQCWQKWVMAQTSVDKLLLFLLGISTTTRSQGPSCLKSLL